MLTNVVLDGRGTESGEKLDIYPRPRNSREEFHSNGGCESQAPALTAVVDRQNQQEFTSVLKVDVSDEGVWQRGHALLQCLREEDGPVRSHHPTFPISTTRK